eukprot:CAMPEP_0178905336 /NCGR_PEP_ID=MMETSP0786-20121207/6219_1 /TAXON_ID=186022 /ORGANISM="Thalassionema frauenfeldii, Strain CCMP 1798" /LENGTH=375 /DNA_ID=CAMNT_0020576933 /DNA_START=133 /DNA_END=1260 /DNA_ORIENTATION=-
MTHGRTILHHNSRHPHARKNTPNWLIKIINILGIVNFVGMTTILFSEHPMPTGQMTPGVKQQSPRTQYNKAVDINKTIQQLRQSGIYNVSVVDHPRLPPWKLIEHQYGRDPIILGLDQCREFREMNANKESRLVTPVGLFNSGTNLLADLLELNCKTQSGENKMSLFQPPWGKHTPREFRDEHTIPHHPYTSIPPSTVLPVVLMRHPFDWMKSMCRRPYAVYWPFDGRNASDFVCPSIVKGHNRTQKIFVSFGAGNQTFESIAHLWNNWNRGWYNSLAFPRLVIRMEDLLFHADKVLAKICACAGGTMIDQFKVPLKSSKSNQLGHYNHETTFLREFIRHGNLQSWDRFLHRDVVAARALLDKELLQIFQYHYHT